MTELLFGDIEDSVMTWLASQLTEYVGDRVPTTTQLPGVVVSRLGGPRVNVAAERATVTIEAWAKDYRTANQLALKARQQVHAIVGQAVAGNAFSRCDEFAGPGRLADPTGALARVVFTVSLTARPT